MPQKMWRHICPQSRSEFWMGTPVCKSCGGPGEYDGWHYSMHEAMARYQSHYGLKPTGQHRRIADELFGLATVKCEACEGRGLRDMAGGATWEVCGACRGFGSLFTRPADEIATLRRRVLEAYPDAAADPVPDFPATPLAFSLAQGEMVNTSESGSSEGLETQVRGFEPDADPWTGVTAAEVAAALDRSLVDDREVGPRSGRFFKPSGDVSVRSALLGAAPSDEDSQAAANGALDGMGEIEEMLARFADVPPQSVVLCSVSSSMVSGSWALCEFRLGRRGYLYYQPDWGIGADESLPILGAWEPAGDPVARRECILRVYARRWSECCLPPAMGEWATGDPELLQAAILRVLGKNPEAWERVFDRLEDCPEPRDAPASTVEEVARWSGAPVDRVRQVLRAVAVRDDQVAVRVRSWSGDEQQRIVVGLLVHCLAKDPFLRDRGDSEDK